MKKKMENFNRQKESLKRASDGNSRAEKCNSLIKSLWSSCHGAVVNESD